MRQQIENTTAFKELDPVTQIIYKKNHVMKEVEREYNIAKTVGLEKYESIYYPNPYKLKVITELLENGSK